MPEMISGMFGSGIRLHQETNSPIMYSISTLNLSRDGFSRTHTYVRLKVAMQGMSTTSFCTQDHKADIKINEREVGILAGKGKTI